MGVAVLKDASVEKTTTRNSSFTTTSSLSSVSVRCRRAFSFKWRLTDTYVLGNLPKVSAELKQQCLFVSGTTDVGSNDSLPSMDNWIPASTARVKTLRTSKRWENIPKNRIKTGAKWVTYLFLCSFCYVSGEIFHAPLYFWSFYTAWSTARAKTQEPGTNLSGAIYPPIDVSIRDITPPSKNTASSRRQTLA